MVFRFESPALFDRAEREGVEPDTYVSLNECPIGYVLRETPYVYRAITAHTWAENGCFNPLESPPWLQMAMSHIGSEKSRLVGRENETQQGRNDASAGTRALKAHNGSR